MAKLTFTPNVPEPVSLSVIVTGATPPEGAIWIAEGDDALRLPIVPYRNEFAIAAGTEGGRRVGSDPDNPEGGAKVYIAANTDAAFWALVDKWQQMIAAMHDKGGSVEFEPPAAGTPITYDVEAQQLAALSADPILLSQRFASSEVVFTCRPYGRRAPVDVIPADSPVSSTDPLLEAEVPNVPGSVKALAKLTLIEAEGQDRAHVVWGLDTNHDPDDPRPVLFAADPSGFTVSSAGFDASFAGAADTEGGVDVIRAELTKTPQAICGSGSQRHIGTWDHQVRLFGTGSGPIWVRLVYKAGSSPRFTPGDWKELQGIDAFYELDLGLMHILEAPEGERTCEWRIEAYSETPGDTLAVHLDQLIPQPGGKARIPFALETPDFYLARDEFDQSAGALHGKSVAKGGVAVGPNSADVFANDPAVPFGHGIPLSVDNWANPSNAAADDAARAVAGTPGAVTYTAYERATDIDAGLPAGAAISGIEVEAKCSAGNGRDNSIRLIKGGVLVGADRARRSEPWPAADAYRSWGGPNDLWGTTWSQADINGTDFGAAISALNGLSDPLPAINHIRITVYYTPSGGPTWNTAGDTDDFEIDDDAHVAVRTAVSDAAGVNDGRFAIVPIGLVAIQAARVTVGSSLTDGDAECGLTLRYFNPDNCLLATIQRSTGILAITKVVDGTPSPLLARSFATLKTPGPLAIAAMATARGTAAVFVEDVLYSIITDPDLATGGQVSVGSAGIYDHKSSAIAEERTFEDFAVWVPVLDRVLFAGFDAEVRSDQFIRQHPTSEWGRIASEADYLKIPPSGLEGRTHRLIAKARRGDVDVLPDDVIDDELAAALEVTPRVLVVGP